MWKNFEADGGGSAVPACEADNGHFPCQRAMAGALAVAKNSVLTKDNMLCDFYSLWLCCSNFHGWRAYAAEKSMGIEDGSTIMLSCLKCDGRNCTF